LSTLLSILQRHVIQAHPYTKRPSTGELETIQLAHAVANLLRWAQINVNYNEDSGLALWPINIAMDSSILATIRHLQHARLASDRLTSPYVPAALFKTLKQMVEQEQAYMADVISGLTLENRPILSLEAILSVTLEVLKGDCLLRNTQAHGPTLADGGTTTEQAHRLTQDCLDLLEALIDTAVLAPGNVSLHELLATPDCLEAIMRASAGTDGQNPRMTASGCSVICGIFSLPGMEDHRSRDEARSFIKMCITDGIAHQPWKHVTMGRKADICLDIATYWANPQARRPWRVSQPFSSAH